jgi:hypothetical protein
MHCYNFARVCAGTARIRFFGAEDLLFQNIPIKENMKQL